MQSSDYARAFEKMPVENTLGNSLPRAAKTLVMNFILKLQVLWDDQSHHPEVTIENFVGQTSMGLPCPPPFFKTSCVPAPTVTDPFAIRV